jgi:hypothetical protein
MMAAKKCSARWLASGREVFMLGPIAGEDLASVWAKLSAWRDGAVIKRVRP